MPPLQVLVIVTGEKKAERVRQVLEGNPASQPLPAQLIKPTPRQADLAFGCSRCIWTALIDKREYSTASLLRTSYLVDGQSRFRCC